MINDLLLFEQVIRTLAGAHALLVHALTEVPRRLFLVQIRSVEEDSAVGLVVDWCL